MIPSYQRLAAHALVSAVVCACGASSTEPQAQPDGIASTSGDAAQAQPTQASAPGAAGSSPAAAMTRSGASQPGQPSSASSTSAAAGAGSLGPDPTANAAAGSGASAEPGASAEGAEMAGAAGTGDAQTMEPPPEACDPADMLPEAEPIALDSVSDSGGAIGQTMGPLMPLIEHDPGLSTHTVYRPATLEEGKKYPIIVWANGGCVKDGLMFARFLLEITSHGFVIVADGEPNGSGMGPLDTNGEPQTQALDWITAEAERPCSKFYRKLETSKIAAMGQSCGGLMTMGVSGDPRLSTVVIWNSGMFDRDQMIYDGLHTPMAYFIGGPDDVAYPQAEDDFAAISTVPLFYGNHPVGHFATYSQPNGGEFARVGIGWLKWQLYGDESETGAKMFLGSDCELCKDPMWTVEKKMME